MDKKNITEIAERAGVSLATVSRVFRNHPNVSRKMREKILNTAHQLKYSPRITAGERSIGLVIESLDEIHSDFTWGENKHLMFASLSDDFANISITCTAPSKTFNLAGLQVSNIFIPNETLRFKFKKAVDAAGYSQVNVMGLEACQAAYEYGEEWLTQLKEYLKDNIAFVREFIHTRLPKLTMIEPEGTYLLWIDFRALGLTEAQRQDLIENKANLWLDSGAMFGPDGEGFERFNVACPRSVLKQAFEQLEAAVNSL